MFHHALAFAEIFVCQGLPVANDHICLVGEDRGDQFADFAARILVVGVGVDNDVGAKRQRKLHAVDESPRETAIAPMPEDIVRAIFQRHFGGVVC